MKRSFLRPHCTVLSFGLVAMLAGCSAEQGSAPPLEMGDDIPAALKEDLDAILDDAVANETTPGVVLHVSAGTKKGWSAARGLADLGADAAMLPEEQCRGGSIMKTFVATAVLRAIEAGSLGLDDAITERLPVGITGRIGNAEAIKVRMLLGQRSGVPEWVTPEVHRVVAADPEHVWSLDEILDRIAAQSPSFPPGERFEYSNSNYILLGEILSGVSGRSWREVVRSEVLGRAGLEHTVLPEPGDPACPGCAHGYVAGGGDLIDLTRVDPSMAGASGGHALVTTAADLTQFLRALRSGALFDDPGTRDAMFAFEPAVDPHLPLVGYGYGVMQLSSNDDIAVGHMGGSAGYQAFMLYVPATDRYVSGFINVMGDIGAVLVPIIGRVSTR
jgi:D-alanyl-D-alanine carboxypeptidase